MQLCNVFFFSRGKLDAALAAHINIDFTIFSRSFLDHFLRHGMPLMDKVFNEMRNDCTALLKNIQLCTRYLQHVCSFFGGKSDAALASHINIDFTIFFQVFFGPFPTARYAIDGQSI